MMLEACSSDSSPEEAEVEAGLVEAGLVGDDEPVLLTAAEDDTATTVAATELTAEAVGLPVVPLRWQGCARARRSVPCCATRPSRAAGPAQLHCPAQSPAPPPLPLPPMHHSSVQLGPHHGGGDFPAPAFEHPPTCSRMPTASTPGKHTLARSRFRCYCRRRQAGWEGGGGICQVR